MSAADVMIIQAPEKIRNTWSVAMRSFTNSRSTCEVESSFDLSTIETGCLISNATTKDLADLGVVVVEKSLHDVIKCLKNSQVQQYTMSFTDSENINLEANLTDEDVDNTFLSKPNFLVQSIFYAAANDQWPTKSNKGLQSILHAFMDNEEHPIVDHLLSLPSKTFTTSLPLNAAQHPQAFKATCNAYELRDGGHNLLQEFAHTQCKFQQLHGDGMNIGHLVMETLSMKDKLSGYTATVQLTITNKNQNV